MYIVGVPSGRYVVTLGFPFQRLLLCCVLLAASSVAQSTGPQAAPLHSLTALIEGPGFVRIPAGEFVMGSRNGSEDEQPPHRVRISRNFEMGKVEVTQAQWDAVMGSAHGGPSAKTGEKDINPSKFKGPARPVENVSWDDVQKFLQKLNARDPAHVYRLPTEAEWEYAARAGTANDAATNLDTAAWFEPNSGGETKPVGQKAPNGWGLHDMQGNVREWVQDWYAADYYEGSPRTDPQGPASSSYKVYRGCAWLSAAKYCRAAYRGFEFPNSADYSVGFRLVRTPK